MVLRRVCGGLRFEIRRSVRGIECSSLFKLPKKEFIPGMRVTRLLYTYYNIMAYISSFLIIQQFVLPFALIRHYPGTIHKESIHILYLQILIVLSCTS